MRLSMRGRKPQRAIGRALVLGLTFVGLLMLAGCEKKEEHAEEEHAVRIIDEDIHIDRDPIPGSSIREDFLDVK